MTESKCIFKYILTMMPQEIKENLKPCAAISSRLYSSQKLLDSDPDLIEAFTRQCRKGNQFTFAYCQFFGNQSHLPLTLVF